MTKKIETAHGLFTIRPYRNEDEKGVIALWETAFKQPMDLRVWRWKYHNNPFGRQMLLCLTDSGTPVAMYGGIPHYGNWDGKNIKLTHLMDNMSHPDYRQAIDGRKGLFLKTAEHFFDTYGGFHASAFIYGFPGIKNSKLATMFLKTQCAEDGGGYYEASPEKIKRRFIIPAGKTSRSESFDDKFDKLWDKVQKDYRFSINRTRQFLTWRFTEHPLHKYEIYTHHHSTEITAYIILFIKDQTAIIADIVSKKSTTHLNRLLYNISRTLQSRHINRIQVWLPGNHFITRQLQSSGFIQKQEPLGMVVAGRSFLEPLRQDFALQNLFYTMADGDLF